MENNKTLFAYVGIILLLYGCTSTRRNTENIIVTTTPIAQVQAFVQKEDLQGLWKGDFSDPFTRYIYIINSNIYYMSAKSQPSVGSFSKKIT
ncbi:MAG TPA: hypothetical protein GX727_05890 [Clostridium sp.]|jgi:hypothetical protein|nr:hypothetical protein [Clostridium sp.]